ncbi:MAG TPA: HlyD family efflux transporter periplasmic adaptor subunit [Candidatus Limnocylindrales bacterium]|nr:HlyD family efflux transporter periplasmic adaptor subunit [Candidatus Limnocylindrales bacterium]
MNQTESIEIVDEAQALPAPEAAFGGRRLPSRWQAIGLFARSDLSALARSWLCRGFFIASAVLTMLELKGMQAKQQPASQMLEAVYVTYLVVWMHAVIFIAGAALMREAECLNDAILSRGVTRGEYIIGKLISRSLAVLLLLSTVLVPASIWAIRQDKLVRTEDGFVTSAARNTKVEAWDPKKIFAEISGTLKELNLKVGDFVHAGDILISLDDRSIFDELETERRSEENARNEVNNAHLKVEEAKRNVAQAQDALERAERSLLAKDLLSKAEQADRQTDIRSRKRDLNNADSQLHTAQEAVPIAERAVDNAMARVRDARRRLALATITAPISGYLTEIQANPGQFVSAGTQLFTIAPLDEYQIKVPVYKFEEFKRLTTNLTAYVKIEQTEYKGTIERLGAMTQPDRWGRDYNHVIVRFKGEGTLGLLGLPADVRLVLPPPKEEPSRATALLNVLTGRSGRSSMSRTTSVTLGWMLLGLGKVLGSACLITTLTFLVLILVRNTLIAILGVIGFYHISNLLYDFVGLKDLSYLEMSATMEKVLGGIAKPGAELITLAWLFGLAIALGVLTAALFVSRDPPK